MNLSTGDFGFFIVSGGWEYNFVLAVIAVSVATIGPGEYSLDHLFGLIESFDGATGLLISAVGGITAAAAQLALFYRPPPPNNCSFSPIRSTAEHRLTINGTLLTP